MNYRPLVIFITFSAHYSQAVERSLRALQHGLLQLTKEIPALSGTFDDTFSNVSAAYNAIKRLKNNKLNFQFIVTRYPN